MLAKTFQDVRAWQLAYQLVLEVYRITAKFPNAEIFGLTSQLRRAMVSVTLNIAEGFKRTSRAERLRFYNMAATSLEEVKCAIMLSRDLHFLTPEEYAGVYGRIDECGRVLHGWIVKN